MSEAELNAALAAAQGKFPAITKDQTADTGTYSYSYASLATVLDECRPILSEHGLAITQLLVVGDDGPGLRTELRHAAGGVIGSTFPFPTMPQKPQELGSLLTYLRRYALLALLGVAAEDDDGAKAQASTTAKQPRQRSRKPTLPPLPSPPPPDDDPGLLDSAALELQKNKIGELFQTKKIGDPGEQRSFVYAVINREIKTRNDLTFAEARKVITKLELFDKDDPDTWPFEAKA